MNECKPLPSVPPARLPWPALERAGNSSSLIMSRALAPPPSVTQFSVGHHTAGPLRTSTRPDIGA